MDKQWHVDWTRFDLIVKAEPRVIALAAKAYPEVDQKTAFYLMLLQRLCPGMFLRPQPDSFSAPMVEALAEWTYISLGRPRWFVDLDMARLLDDTSIDPDLSQIVWPYDVVTLVFEKGFEVNGFPLRWVRIGTFRSKLCADLLEQKMRFKMDFADFFLAQCEFGEVGKTGKFSQDAPVFDSATCYSWRTYSDYRKGTAIDSSLNASEQKALDLATKIAATAMLYYSARPELIVDYTLPRSQRYRQIGDREQMKRVLLPTAKNVYVRHVQTESRGGQIQPHFRGWVLRSLRHPRFKRNSDGSVRTVLIPPCAVHPELMDK